MVGLIDIAQVVDRIEIGSETFDVPGINLDSLAKLIKRFPEFGKSAVEGKFDAASLFSLGPEFAGAFMAAGMDPNWTPEAEQVMRLLPLDYQARIMESVLRVTMPRGAGPFVQTLRLLAKSMGVELTDPVSSGGSPKTGSTRRQSSRAS